MCLFFLTHWGLGLFSNACYPHDQGNGFSHPFSTRPEPTAGVSTLLQAEMSLAEPPWLTCTPRAMGRGRGTPKWEVIPGLLCCWDHIRGRGWGERAISQWKHSSQWRTGLCSNQITPKILSIPFLNPLPLILMATFYPCCSFHIWLWTDRRFSGEWSEDCGERMSDVPRNYSVKLWDPLSKDGNHQHLPLCFPPQEGSLYFLSLNGLVLSLASTTKMRSIWYSGLLPLGS